MDILKDGLTDVKSNIVAFFVMYLLYINLADTMKYIVRVNGGKSAETGNWKKGKDIREKNKVKKTLRLCKKYQYL